MLMRSIFGTVRRWPCLLVLAVLSFTTGRADEVVDNSLTQLENRLNEVIFRLSRSIVTIEASYPVESFQRSSSADEAMYHLVSTGIIYDSTGKILTLASSVAGHSRVSVIFENQVLPAEIFAIDYRSGLALLKVPHRVGQPVNPAMEQGCAGQMVMALGNAYGLRATPSLGFCGGVRADGIVQFTAPVTSGALGGGLFTLSGRLVGIINGGIGDQPENGIGLACPAHEIVESVEYMLTHGDRQAGYIGWTVAETELVPPATIRLPNQLTSGGSCETLIRGGLVVDRVVPGSPAARAGLRTGDLVFRVNGEHLFSALDLATMVKSSPPGKVLVMDVLRDQTPYRAKVTLSQSTLVPQLPFTGGIPYPDACEVAIDALLRELDSVKQVVRSIEYRVGQGR